jgi:hypothetical protein
MTLLNSMAGYRSGYDDYDEDDHFDPEQLHPTVRKQARRIVQCERNSTLMKWWISTIGTLAVIACMTAVVLSGLDLVLASMATMTFSVVLTVYLISLAHCPARRA